MRSNCAGLRVLLFVRQSNNLGSPEGRVSFVYMGGQPHAVETAAPKVGVPVRELRIEFLPSHASARPGKAIRELAFPIQRHCWSLINSCCTSVIPISCLPR